MQQVLRPRTPWTTISRGTVFRNKSFFHSSPRSHLQFTRTLRQESRSEIPSFREKVTTEIQPEAFTEKVGRPGAGHQILVRFYLTSSSQSIP